MTATVHINCVEPDKSTAEAIFNYLEEHGFACSIKLLDDRRSESPTAANQAVNAINQAQAAIFVASPNVSLDKRAWNDPYWQQIEHAEKIKKPFLILCTSGFRPGSSPPYPLAFMWDNRGRNILPHYMDMRGLTFDRQLPLLAETLTKILDGRFSFSSQPLWPLEQVHGIEYRLLRLKWKKMLILLLASLSLPVSFMYAGLFLSFQIALLVIIGYIVIGAGLYSYLSWRDLREPKMLALNMKTVSVGIPFFEYLGAVLENQQSYFLSRLVPLTKRGLGAMPIFLIVVAAITVVIAWLTGALLSSWSASLGFHFAAIALLFTLMFLAIIFTQTRFLVSREMNKMLYCGEEPCSELSSVIIHGQLTMPRQSRLGDSHNIIVTVSSVKGATGCLEVELQAAGMKVNGGLKQVQPLENSSLFYRWNCNSAISGRHIINFVFRRAESPGEPFKELAFKKYVIDVITLYRQYGPSFVLALVAILAFLYGLRIDFASLLHALGL